MLSFSTILLILLTHWLADFGLQTHDQAMGKSKELIPLMDHVGVYSLVWLMVSYCIFDSMEKAIIFGLVTFFCHMITDYSTSRLGKSFWDKGDYHNGFVIVGFDQILHYVQLFLTYIWLS